MKITTPFIFSVALFALTACKKETTVSDKVGDALNTRDHEKVRDTAEDIEKDVKKVGESIGDKIKAVDKEIKKEVRQATE